MGRYIKTMGYEAAMWDTRCTARLNVAVDLQDGIQAYARRQAHIRRQRAIGAARLWLTVLPIAPDVPPKTAAA